jgi:predicted metalloprotease with PDZ domain
MYRKFYESPATSYYLHGRGYTDADILKAVNQVSGADFAPFFQKYVAGTDPLPYNETLAKAGLTLHIATSHNAPPSLGALVEPVDTGDKIISVVPGSAADRAGLSCDDILISVDDQSLATDTLDNRLGIYPAGAKVLLEVQRRETRRFIYVQLDPPQPDEYSITEAPDATEDQIKVRQGWLEGGQAGTSQSTPADAQAGEVRKSASS